MPHECDNCARPDDELVAVRRVYITPGDAEHETVVDVVDAIEHWCVSCVTQYPCEVVPQTA